jgi:hypothetical protein
MEQVVVDCEWPEYTQAVERLAHFVLKKSAERFGLGIFERKPLRIKITITGPPIPQKNLYYTIGKEITIYWIRSSEKDPSPEKYLKSLVRSDGSMYGTMIFGLLHEIGHSVLPDLMEDHPPELPECLFEGWATFFAWSMIPLVWEELGEDAWPITHNYFDYEMNRKRKTIEDPQDLEEYYVSVFFRIEEESGGTGISKIIGGLRQRNAVTVKELDRVLKQIKRPQLKN